MKRYGFTLTEVLISLIIISIFFVTLLTVFEVVIRSYDVNKTAVSRLYVETNIDSLFNIIEKELRYAGSLSKYISETQSTPTKGATITDNQLKVSYAIAEKIILKKHENDAYSKVTYSGSDTIIENPTNTYYAIFNSILPDLKNNSLKAFLFDDISTPTEVYFINIYSKKPIDTSAGSATEIYATKTTDGNKIEDLSNASETWYISPFSYETSEAIGDGIELTDGTIWYGENVFITTIFASHTDNGTSVFMQKKLPAFVPTIDASYTVMLADNIEKLKLTSTSSETINVEIEYKIPAGNFFVKEKTFKKERTFFY